VRYVNTPPFRAQRIIGTGSRLGTPIHSASRRQGRGSPPVTTRGEQMATTDLAEQQLLIDGEWRAARSGDTFSRLNPYTGETATRASAGGREDARAAVDAAHAAFAQWSQTGPGERRAILSRAAELITERQNEIAATMIEETGATFGWGMFNCMLASGMLREAAAQTYGMLGEVIPSDVPGKLAMAVRAPAGVVVGIAPWNAPVILAARAVAMPLAFGNTVVLKASELCPRTHAHVAAAIADAGVPPGVINFVTNQPQDAADVVEELIAHPHTRRVNFTGSTRVGRIIAEIAGRNLKRTLLELGGKAPLIVLADADLERAAAATSFGAFFHQGQICMSTERVIVERSVAEPFAELLATRARALRVGDPRDPETQIGPLINDVRDGARRRAGRGRAGAWRAGARRRRARRRLLPADGSVRRQLRDARLRARSRSARWRRSSRSTASSMRSRSPTTPSTASSAAVFSAERASGPRARPARPERHLPHQRHDGPRRAADAVRRRQGRAAGAASAGVRRSRSSPSCAGSRSRRASATTRSDRGGAPCAARRHAGPRARPAPDRRPRAR
jgi:acyl-CoA reductase-like NAD-dependent aldehyde dehydrogenase